MHRKNVLGLAPKLTSVVAPFVFGLALTLAGCASTDGTSADGTPAPDDITSQELAAGEAAGPAASIDDAPAAADAMEPATATHAAAEEPALTVAPAEDARPFLDPEELAFNDPATPPGVIDPDNMNQTESCHRVTGYRSGHRMNICVTTIDGKYVEVNTARAYLRMRKAARKAGVYMSVVSGFRSMASQRYLYHCYVTHSCNGGNLAAVPGYSNHQSGHALDLNTASPGVYSYLVNHGHAFGFRRTVPSERWHWEH